MNLEQLKEKREKLVAQKGQIEVQLHEMNAAVKAQTENLCGHLGAIQNLNDLIAQEEAEVAARDQLKKTVSEAKPAEPLSLVQSTEAKGKQSVKKANS